MNLAKTLTAALLAASLACVQPAAAREYYVGGPVHIQDMEIVAAYLIGVEMAPMPKDMPMGRDVIHLEADVHATADNKYGYPDGAWIPYLTINYQIEKIGTNWKANGRFKQMIAKDGPHYADSIKMNGKGRYKVTYSFYPPETNGFLRHVDKETGVPDWWKPFSTSFTFNYG